MRIRSKIWEVKRRVTRKNTVKRQIKNSKGKILQDSEEIVKEYEEYYKQFLTTRKPENTAETIAEERVKKEFESIMKQKNDRREKITFTMVKKAISTMKKRKGGDKVGWKAEWLIEGGDEMIRSLEILYNRIEQEKIISKQWQQVIIKSVDKKGSGDELSKNQRGLILVNIVSKVYEKIKKTERN